MKLQNKAPNSLQKSLKDYICGKRSRGLIQTPPTTLGPGQLARSVPPCRRAWFSATGWGGADNTIMNHIARILVNQLLFILHLITRTFYEKKLARSFLVCPDNSPSLSMAGGFIIILSFYFIVFFFNNNCFEPDFTVHFVVSFVFFSFRVS